MNIPYGGFVGVLIVQSPNQPLSRNAASRNLFRCRHFPDISDFLFNIILSSPFAISTFSSMHSAHLLAVGLYGLKLPYVG